MDTSDRSLLQPQEESSSILFNCDGLINRPCDPLVYDPSMDSGYFSACSSLSPTSSVDSFSLSPDTLQVKTEQDPQDCFFFSRGPQRASTNIQILPLPPLTASASKKSRSRYPGKKRQTASEREKLRMRDLTKALHYLRTFLPESVAPEGQALTKIETLRLTISYIRQLSTQLGLTEEDLQHRRASGRVEPLISLQETPQPLSWSCPGAHVSPMMVSAGLCYNTRSTDSQWQYPHIGFKGQF